MHVGLFEDMLSADTEMSTGCGTCYSEAVNFCCPIVCIARSDIEVVRQLLSSESDGGALIEVAA